MVGKWHPVLLPKVCESQWTNPISNERRTALPFRTGTGTGAAAVASRPPPRRLSVWVSPSSGGQIFLARVLNGGVGSVHSGSPTNTGSTENASKERMRSFDLDGLRALGTSPQPRSSPAALGLHVPPSSSAADTHNPDQPGRQPRPLLITVLPPLAEPLRSRAGLEDLGEATVNYMGLLNTSCLSSKLIKISH